jgi:ketosteroid isomerase-like protein
MLVLVAAAVAFADASAQSDLARQVEAREIAFAQSMADRDLDAFAEFVSEEAIFFNSRNEALRGREVIVGAWAPFFEGPAPFSWRPDVVQVLDSGGLALTSGPVHDPSGALVGRFNSVWRLEPDGQWRVVFDKGS